MNDRNGFKILVDCYVRVHPPEPRKSYKGWVVDFAMFGSGGIGTELVVVENDKGHRESFAPARVEVLKPTLKAKAARERRRDLVHAVSARAHANRRF